MKGRIFLIISILICFFTFSLINVNASSYVRGGVGLDKKLGLKQIDWYKDNVINETKVTDKGVFDKSQCYNEIDINNYGISLNQIKEQDYHSLMVTIELYIKEVNDGYQELYICKDARNSSSSIISVYKNFEHGSKKLDTTYKNYKFYIELLIDDLSISTFTIRYGAHGNLDDTWMFKCLTVELMLSHEYPKINQLAYLKNLNECYFSS